MKRIHAVEDLAEAFVGLWEAVSDGGITPDEARMVVDMLEKHKEVLKARDLERRLTIMQDKMREREA